jgi:hypothetical protein
MNALLMKLLCLCHCYPQRNKKNLKLWLKSKILLNAVTLLTISMLRQVKKRIKASSEMIYESST